MIYLVGASGHGLVILDILQKQGKQVHAFVDDADKPPVFGGLPVLKTEQLNLKPTDEIIVSIGSNAARFRVAERLTGSAFQTAIHPTAVLGNGVCIGEGTVVMAGAILNPFAQIGKHCIINTGAVVDHECVLGDFVHISPHATLCGNVRVGNHSWVAAGATVIPNITIGANVVIGAGAVVIRDVPDNCVMVGNPAKRIQK